MKINQKLLKNPKNRDLEVEKCSDRPKKNCIESGERGLTGVSRETPKFDGFGDFWKPSRGPIGPILYGFVVLGGTTKP